MHRDNLAVPVGEFVDAMEEERAAGRVRAYGVSNWTLDRVDEATEYAARHGRAGFAALSNHFSLAEAYAVPWDGCVHVTDPASRAWLRTHDLPLLPWSSQARGFFTGRARPDDRSDEELVRCYYSDTNFGAARQGRSTRRVTRGPRHRRRPRLRAAPTVPDVPAHRPTHHRRDPRLPARTGRRPHPGQVAWLENGEQA